MINYKTDPDLGLDIRKNLLELKLENPITKNNQKYNDKEKKEIISSLHRNIMQALGLDLENDSLKDTPDRVAKMYVQEIFKGLNYHNFPKCTTSENDFGFDQMVIEKGIVVSSTCEHHFQSISGKCKIAYIPKDKVLGLSKLNRVVDFFSRRPQIQERLVSQIQASLVFILKTEDVAVELSAEHHCIKNRGVEQHGCDTVTRVLGGCFKRLDVRTEFLNS